MRCDNAHTLSRKIIWVVWWVVGGGMLATTKTKFFRLVKHFEILRQTEQAVVSLRQGLKVEIKDKG